eukprot:3660326-Alexandrium_andersonii.AAC.1
MAGRKPKYVMELKQVRVSAGQFSHLCGLVGPIGLTVSASCARALWATGRVGRGRRMSGLALFGRRAVACWIGIYARWARP